MWILLLCPSRIYFCDTLSHRNPSLLQKVSLAKVPSQHVGIWIGNAINLNVLFLLLGRLFLDTMLKDFFFLPEKKNHIQVKVSMNLHLSSLWIFSFLSLSSGTIRKLTHGQWWLHWVCLEMLLVSVFLVTGYMQ